MTYYCAQCGGRLDGTVHVCGPMFALPDGGKMNDEQLELQRELIALIRQQIAATVVPAPTPAEVAETARQQAAFEAARSAQLAIQQEGLALHRAMLALAERQAVALERIAAGIESCLVPR